jgi:hypothetical protein
MNFSDESKKKKDPIAVELGRRGGKASANKLAKNLNKAQRRQLGKDLAKARWAKARKGGTSR